MYVILRTGARQYRAEVGQEIDVDRLPNAENEEITITDVLLFGDGDGTVVGTPNVEGVTVSATVTKQYRGPKVIVFRYRQRTNYRRKTGHRQYFTRLRIDAINR
jgi:large subunit ribosomal protein L21